MAAPAFSEFGSGTGWIYTTLADGTTIINSVRNDSVGREIILAQATSMASISSATSQYDTTYRYGGNRFFFASNASAVEGVLYVDNLEITRNVIGRDFRSPLFYATATIAGGAATVTRVGSYMNLVLTGQGGVSDDLDTITISDAIVGDILVINTVAAAQVITVKHNTGNIFLSASTDFASNAISAQIILKFNNIAPNTSGWYEVSRSAVFPTVANLRTQSVAIPVQGTTSTTIGNGGGTLTLTPGTSKEYQRLSGSPVLVAPYATAFAGTPKDGDHFIIDYQATATLGGQTITLAGINLTTDQALNGRTIVYAYYDSTGATWRSFAFEDTSGIDLVTSTQLSTKQDAFTAPAADGYLVSINTDLSIDLIPVPNSILYNTTANNGTTAVLTEEFLKTYAMDANTLDTDGDVLYCKTIYQTAANANAKTETFYFGATAVATITGNFNADTVIIEGHITRVDATNQRASFTATSYDTATGAWGASNAFYTSPAENLAVAINIRAASTNGVAAVNDSINRTMFVQKMDK